MVNWISLNTTGGTSGTSQISLTVAANNDYSARTTSLTVTTLSKNLTETVVINQAQKTATGSMAFSPSALTYTYQGGILYLNFTANTDWNVVSWPTWVGISGDGTSGSAGTFTWGVTAASNSSDARNSTFTFYCGGNYFTVPVYQEAYQESPSLSVSPTTVNNISSGGTSFNITVTSNTGWTITSYPNWVSLNVTGGSGNGAVTVTVNPNSSSSRTDNIVFQTTGGSVTKNVLLNQDSTDTTDYNGEYLTFEMLENGEIMYISNNKYIDYRINGGEWTTISNTGSQGTGTTIAVLNSGDKINFRGINSYYGDDTHKINLKSNGLHNTYGNIMSLFYGDNFYSATTFPINKIYILNTLFGSDKVVSAKNLKLPVTELTQGCYNSMFNNCTSLTTAPELPAINLPSKCYTNMFYGCTSLTTAPSHIGASASTVSESACTQMFYGCTSLTTAPELPATTLSNGCYGRMFYQCEKIKYIKCLALNARYCCPYWLFGVPGTPGHGSYTYERIFVKNSLNNNWIRGVSGIPDLWTVQDA